MNRTWLVIDCNYLCHRAYHALGHLKDGGHMGAIWGFLRDTLTLMDDHNTRDVVFCFDNGKGLREDVSPNYKITRRTDFANLPTQEQDSVAKFRSEVVRLREIYLPKIGYRNICTAPGYEADDCIASWCIHTLPPGDTALIVSSDHDLWQLLRPGVIWYNPTLRKPVTHDSFRKQWQMPVKMWAKVKALAGCKSDDVTGMDGIGEATAAKYYAGTLPEHHKAYAKIKAGEQDYLRLNLPLVTLPYPGCPRFDIQEDCVTQERWNYAVNRLGFSTLFGRAPVQQVRPDMPTFGVS